jgi:hypothetical protein
MNLLEHVDGSISRLLSLFGSDVSPRRPGEPMSRDPTAYLAEFNQNGDNFDTKSQGLYPKLNRMEMLRLMDDMDATDIAASVLDMMAEDATADDGESHSTIKVEGLDAVTKPVRAMLRAIKADDTLYSDTREMCKNGSYFRRLLYNTTDGVTHSLDANVNDIDIVRNPVTQEVRGYKHRGHMFRDKNSPCSWPWDFSHYKLAGKKQYEPYGTPLLAAGIRAWTMLTLAEDKALTYRIQRQPDRLVFKIDVGSASEAEAWRAIQAYRRSVNRKVVLDPILSRLKQEYNPLGALENLYMGVRPNSNTAVDLLQGSQNVQDVTDLLYYLKKFLTSVRIPPPMFGLPMETGDAYARNKRLQNQDVRYARHIKRIQRAVCDTYMQTARVHLRLIASDVEDPRLNYDADENGKGGLRISLRAPSFLEELERLELTQLRMQIANDMVAMTGTLQTIEVFEWTLFVFREVLRLPEHVIKKVVQHPPPPEAEDGEGGSSTPAPVHPRRAVARRPVGTPRIQPSLPATPLAGTTPLGASVTREFDGPPLTDNGGFNYTNGGTLNEEQLSRLERMIGRSPSLRNRIDRARVLFDEHSDFSDED